MAEGRSEVSCCVDAFFRLDVPREGSNWTCPIRCRPSVIVSSSALVRFSFPLTFPVCILLFLSLPPSSYCLRLNLGVTHLVMLLPKSHFLGRIALAEGRCAITCPIIKLSPTISWETPDGRGQSRPDTRRSGVLTGLFHKPPADVFLRKIYWGEFYFFAIATSDCYYRYQLLQRQHKDRRVMGTDSPEFKSSRQRRPQTDSLVCCTQNVKDMISLGLAIIFPRFVRWTVDVRG